MAHLEKTAGNGVAPGSVAPTDRQIAAATAEWPDLRDAPDTVVRTSVGPEDDDGGGSESHARRMLAVRAACDITDIIGLLAGFDGDNLASAVVQMVQQRIHALACGVLSAIDDPNETLSAIQERLYPDELPRGGAHA